MLSRICLETASHHTFHNHFNFLASHCTAPFSTAQATGIHWHTLATLATLALWGVSCPQQPPTAAAPAATHSSRPQQPPTCSRPTAAAPAAAPAAAHLQPPTTALQSFPSYLDRFTLPRPLEGVFEAYCPNMPHFNLFPHISTVPEPSALWGLYPGGIIGFMGVYRGV
jgi:hypothetical protein